MTKNFKVLFKAEFHPILIHYLFFYVLGFLFVIVVSIPLIPFWLIIGYYFCRRYYRRLECVLTEQTLELKKGHFFRVEKTIPLDKIQDLTLREGPLLRLFKICMLDIETAGQSNPQGASDAKIIGITDVRDFRDKVLAQRDLVVAQGFKSPQKMIEQEDDVSVFVEMRDSLHRIEKLLKR